MGLKRVNKFLLQCIGLKWVYKCYRVIEGYTCYYRVKECLQGQRGFINVTGLRRFYKCYGVKEG